MPAVAEATRQRPDAPLAGAELALPYLLEDADFATFARRAAAGATRARVSEPLLGALVAALWTSRAGLEPRGLAVLVGDDEAARALCESAGAFLPGEPVAFMPSRGAAHGSGLDPAPHLAGERSRALHTLAAGGLVAVSVTGPAYLGRCPQGRRQRLVRRRSRRNDMRGEGRGGAQDRYL